jgi:hypothetical protein
MGLLSNAGPPSWHPAPDNVKKVCAAAGQYCKVRTTPITSRYSPVKEHRLSRMHEQGIYKGLWDLWPVRRLLSESCCLVSVRRPLWWEVGSVICQAQSVVICRYLHLICLTQFSNVYYWYSLFTSCALYTLLCHSLQILNFVRFTNIITVTVKNNNTVDWHTVVTISDKYKKLQRSRYNMHFAFLLWLWP